MSQRVYISADYSADDGDRDVINELHSWGKDAKHKVDYVDTAQVASRSISNDKDCRPCDLKKEFMRRFVPLQQLFSLLVIKQLPAQLAAHVREIVMARDVIVHHISKMRMDQIPVKYMEKHQHQVPMMT